MLTFTLDTNCLIAVERHEPEATRIQALADANSAGKAHVAVVAISASEKQQDGRSIDNFDNFRARLSTLGLKQLEILPALGYIDVTFFDWCIFPSADDVVLEREIHEILFPNVQFLWQDYRAAHSLNPLETHPSGRWRNCKCDVLGLWSHIHFKRDVFVSSDENFHRATKKPALLALGANRIETPVTAVSLV